MLTNECCVTTLDAFNYYLKLIRKSTLFTFGFVKKRQFSAKVLQGGAEIHLGQWIRYEYAWGICLRSGFSLGKKTNKQTID